MTGDDQITDDECGGCGRDGCCGIAYNEPWSNTCHTIGIGCPKPEEGKAMCFEDWNPEIHPEFYCMADLGALRLYSIAATLVLLF